jgi:EVE domain
MSSTVDTKKYWVAVASQEHVQHGMHEGFVQLCHGKRAPFKAMKPGDKIIYYSPTKIFGEKTPYQKFTALGTIQSDVPYHVGEQSLWRMHATYTPVKEVAIKELIPLLDCITNKKYWGMPFRRGIFSISEKDFKLIEKHMNLKKSS